MTKYKWNRIAILLTIVVMVVLTAGCITIEKPSPLKRPSTPPDDSSITPPPASQNKDLPAIMSFSVNPVEVSPGEDSTLSWDVANANSITIEPEIGDVSASGSIIVTPEASTIYTLTASNASGELKASTELKVKSNENAMSIALTIDDVIASGFTFSNDYTPAINNAVSTYSISFIKGEEILTNSVYIYPTAALAERDYFLIREKYTDHTNDIYSIREQRAFVFTDLSGTPDKPELFIIRLTKNNVLVELGSISNYQELVNYALLIEARIK